MLDRVRDVRIRRHAWSMWVGRASIVATCWLTLSACARQTEATLDIATTTSVQNSGLLDVLLPTYRTEHGVSVRVHAAGSGRALSMLGEGLAQLVISHAPDAEAAALRTHSSWVRHPLARNWFVIVGPTHDPAQVRGAADAIDAFGRIADSQATFVSRGDQSGTHERENALWTELKKKPAEARYLTSGRGMALALRHADEVQGYSLSDDATFLQLAPELDLEILYRGDERLLNEYSVIYPREDVAAGRLAEWLVRGNGRDLIGRFTIAGQHVFELPSR